MMIEQFVDFGNHKSLSALCQEDFKTVNVHYMLVLSLKVKRALLHGHNFHCPTQRCHLDTARIQDIDLGGDGPCALLEIHCNLLDTGWRLTQILKTFVCSFRVRVCVYARAYGKY